MSKNTIAQDYQDLLYQLFTTEIMSLPGETDIDENGRSETYIPKSSLLEGFIKVLNEVGETMAEDQRLKGEQDEINNRQDKQVSEQVEEVQRLPIKDTNEG